MIWDTQPEAAGAGSSWKIFSSLVGRAHKEIYETPKSPSTRLWWETDLYRKPIMCKPIFHFSTWYSKFFTARGLHKIRHSSLFVPVFLPVLVFLIHCPVKRWIALRTRLITIQRISIRETNCTIHWIEIYSLDSAIQPLNNRGLMYEVKSEPIGSSRRLVFTVWNLHLFILLVLRKTLKKVLLMSLLVYRTTAHN